MYCFHLRELSCRTSKDAGNHLTEFVDSHSNSRTADSFLKTLISESYLYFSPNQSIVDIPFLVDCPRTVITFKRWHFKYGPDNVQIWRLTGGGGNIFYFAQPPCPVPLGEEQRACPLENNGFIQDNRMINSRDRLVRTRPC